MIPLVTGEEALRRLFSALTEHAFQVELGVADPPLTDYLVDMLLRFTRAESMYRHRDAEGKRLVEVVDMLEEARLRESRPQRELHRHIGDYTLFWSGVYPEALPRLQSSGSKDRLIDFEAQGRASYGIASRFENEPFEQEAPVLKRLSEDFELCREGLNRVRKEWDLLPAETTSRSQSEEPGGADP